MEAIKTVATFAPSVSCARLLGDLEFGDDGFEVHFCLCLKRDFQRSSPVTAGDVLRIADEVGLSKKRRAELLEILLEISPDASGVLFRSIGATLAELCLPLLEDCGTTAGQVAREMLNAIRLFAAGRLSEEGLGNIWAESRLPDIAKVLDGEFGERGPVNALWAFSYAAFGDIDKQTAPTSIYTVLECVRDGFAAEDPRYIAAKDMLAAAVGAEGAWQRGTRLDFRFVRETGEQHLSRLLDEIKGEQSEEVDGAILAAMLRHLRV